jgi:hypothetical protein
MLNSEESYRMEAFRVSNTKRDYRGGGSHADVAEAAADNQEKLPAKVLADNIIPHFIGFLFLR